VRLVAGGAGEMISCAITMNLPEELAFRRLSPEEKYRRAVPGYMRRIRGLYDALFERLGEEGLDLIREVSREFGRSIGANVRKKGPLEGLAQVGTYLLKVFDMVSDDWQVEEFNDRRLVISVSRCPYGFTRDAICRAHTCMEQALVATLDDRLDYRVGRSIPQGDVCCEHVLSVKEPATESSVAGSGNGLPEDDSEHA
jgi:hypothetical protein